LFVFHLSIFFVHISTDNTFVLLLFYFCFTFSILVFNSGWGYAVSAGAEIPGVGIGLEVSVGVDAEFDKKVDKYPKINWNSGKSLAVALGVGIDFNPLPFGGNIGTDYMAHVWSVKCTDHFQKLAPYCEAVVLFMTPPGTVPLIMKVAVMRSFMKAWCPDQTDSILCSETSKIEAGTSTLLFIEENVNDQITTRVRGVDEVWGEIVSLWAKLGTKMMNVFQAALKIGRNIGKMAEKIQTEFVAMAKSAEEVVDKWLAEHVGKRLDALREHFGDFKPEDQPDQHFSIPSGKGVYIKIKDCGRLADEDGETLEAPYFDCYPYEEQKKSIRRRLLKSKGFFGDDDDLDDDQKKTTEIGEHKGPDKSRYYWDCTFEKSEKFQILECFDLQTFTVIGVIIVILLFFLKVHFSSNVFL